MDKRAIPHRGWSEAKPAVYDCLVPYDDKSMETSLNSLDMLQLLLLDYIAVLRM